MPFAYATHPHTRRHGPLEYKAPQSFKPWLRDEFTFQCVYCLWRENWCADGDDSFSVEHLYPRVTHPDRVCDYENLLYACCRCNSLKQDAQPVLDPCEHAWGDHLAAEEDGTLSALSPEGERLLEVCRLNRPLLVEASSRMMKVMEKLRTTATEEALALLRHYLAFPVNLPALSKLKPPGGNYRSEGIAESYYEQREAGKLSETY